MHSQNDEERHILDAFRGRPEGNFLDIGAYDGITLSNTYCLALKGWSGVCAEARRFEKSYPLGDRLAEGMSFLNIFSLLEFREQTTGAQWASTHLRMDHVTMFS